MIRAEALICFVAAIIILYLKKELSDYHSHYMSDKIQKFFSGNLEVEVLKELQPPDGSPIGSNDLYLFKCGSEL